MITFYTAYANLGGVEQLIVNLSRELQRQGVDHKFLGPPNSVTWQLLAGHLPGRRMFDAEALFGWHCAPGMGAARRQALARDDLLLLPNPQDALRIRWPNPRVLFWNVAPEVLLLGALRPLRWLNRRWKARMLRHLSRSGSLCFMDDTGVRWMQRAFGLSLESPEYLPIPAGAAGRNAFLERGGGGRFGPLTLTYMGRAVDWKVYPCAHFLRQAAALTTLGRVHIFTDDAAAFRRLLGEPGASPPVGLVFHENLYEADMRAKLLELSDLHFAMGTSALDGAGLGLPTVLIDPFSDPAVADCVRYRWMHETRHFSLGELITRENRHSVGRPLGDLLRELQADRAAVSRCCHDYVRAYHDLSRVAQRFVTLAERARARLRCLHAGAALDLVELLPQKLRRARPA